MTDEATKQHTSKSEVVAVGIFLIVQIFACGGFVFTVRDQLTNVTTELHELNRTVAAGQVVSGKIVEHLISVDRRLELLESAPSRRQP